LPFSFSSTTLSANLSEILMSDLQRSLVLLKPDAIQRGIIGEILTRFERVGARMIGLKMLVSDKDTAAQHYTDDLAKRRGEHVRKMMIDLITSGPIVAIALEGVDMVEVVRKMIGSTEPKSAAPGTIRGDYSHMSFGYADSKGVGIFNLVHASGSPEEGVSEIAVWFKPEELLTYNKIDDQFHFPTA
jgi:nucleoside-diphosphate kinase